MHLIYSRDSQAPTKTNAGIIEAIEKAFNSLIEANDAATALAERLSPVMPQGAPEEIHGLLATGARHADANEGDAALTVLIHGLSRRADALAGALTAAHGALRI